MSPPIRGPAPGAMGEVFVGRRRELDAIAEQLHVSQSAVEKHINSIFDKLGLFDATRYGRRVLAVLRYLRS